LTETGLKPEVVRILHPLAAALYITARVPAGPQPNAGTLLDRLVGTPRHYEGTYLEFDDANGRARSCSHSSDRVGGGQSFAHENDAQFPHL
jgi:hypothetical protein